MNKKLNPKWVKLLMGGATLGLFAYLLTNQLVGKTSIKWAAAVLSGVIMLVLTTAFKKRQNPGAGPGYFHAGRYVPDPSHHGLIKAGG
ncbi:MAG: DUF5058 family protein [Oscillospiraceae bacterium]